MITIAQDTIELTQFSRADNSQTSGCSLECTIVGRIRGQDVIHHQTQQIEDLNQHEADLKLIFTEPDLPTPRNARGLASLFTHYDFPNAFISERLQSVVRSYGTHEWENGAKCSWFHFLCKNITLVSNSQTSQITGPSENPGTLTISQSDHSWIRSAYFLKCEPNTPACTRSDSGAAVAPSLALKKLTLICFGAPENLKEKLEKYLQQSSWEEALSDPFILFEMVVDSLFGQFDQMVWNVSTVFSGIENKILERALKPGTAADRVDFVGLHNVSKHIIYLNEAADGMLLTIESIQASRRYFSSQPFTTLESITTEGLGYRKGLFQSTQLRLKSLEKRMQNIINLSFNLVTQQDSRIMQRDSSSMNTIAVVTLLFLPITTVASIFGMQFFSFTSNVDGGNDFRVSRYFGVFWLFSSLVTGLVFALWKYCYSRAKSRLGRGLEEQDVGIM